jgi:hypothetical protein
MRQGSLGANLRYPVRMAIEQLILLMSDLYLQLVSIVDVR